MHIHEVMRLFNKNEYAKREIVAVSESCFKHNGKISKDFGISKMMLEENILAEELEFVVKN